VIPTARSLVEQDSLASPRPLRRQPERPPGRTRDDDRGCHRRRPSTSGFFRMLHEEGARSALHPTEDVRRHPHARREGARARHPTRARRR